MLEMRNFLQKKINKKGFTLAELLVVVAIIAILVAVSIPIFTGKLSEAKKNTDLANVRAAKAAAVTYYLQNDGDNTNKFYDAENGKMVDTVPTVGYNQTKQNSDALAAKAGVVQVTITGTEEKPVVNAVWVPKG